MPEIAVRIDFQNPAKSYVTQEIQKWTWGATLGIPQDSLKMKVVQINSAKWWDSWPKIL